MKAFKVIFILVTTFSLISIGSYANYNLVVLRLTNTQNNYYDETAVRFLPGATDSFDGAYDAWKLFSTTQGVPSLYSKEASDYELSINSFDQLSEDNTVDLFTRIDVSGNFEISVINYDAMPGVKIYLEDLQTGVITELEANTSFNLFLDDGVDENRFRLRFSTPIEVQSTPLECANYNDGTITLSDFGNHNFAYDLFNDSSNLIISENNVDETAYITELAPGNYTIVATTDFGTIENFEVEITSPTPVIANFTANENIELSNEEILDIVNLSTNGADYIWDFGDGTISYDSSPEYTYEEEGEYELLLTVESGQCSDILSKTITVLNSQSTSVIENLNDNVQVYYSMNSIIINSDINVSTDYKLELININGAKVFSKQYPKYTSLNDKITIDLSTGIYIVNLAINDQIISKKISVQL